ncbi:MAG: hypothetical protein ACN6RK_02140, partial [Stenotrophomonas sp.]
MSSPLDGRRFSGGRFHLGFKTGACLESPTGSVGFPTPTAPPRDAFTNIKAFTVPARNLQLSQQLPHTLPGTPHDVPLHHLCSLPDPHA